MREIIMAFQGEMALKGLNRGTFEAKMTKAVRTRLADLGEFKLRTAQSTLYIQPLDEDIDMDEAFRRVSKVFGIARLSRAAVCEKDFAAICQTAEDYLGQTLRGIKTFKVEAKRSDKTFPMKSPELCRELGAFLLSKHPHLRVDVHNPQLEVMVEIRDFGAYIHGPKVPGPRRPAGGHQRPRAESAVRRHRQPVARLVHGAARPGFAPHPFCLAALHQPARQAQGGGAGAGGQRVHRQLHAVCGALHQAPGAHPGQRPDVLFTVLMRRSMLRIANLVAATTDMQALVTGESLAQVASQTLAALACTDAAQDLPVLRPLIGMDKTEIVARSREIGTFETSIEPYEDCCTIFTPPHPKTSPPWPRSRPAEAAMPGLAELEREAAANVEKIPIHIGDDPEM